MVLGHILCILCSNATTYTNLVPSVSIVVDRQRDPVNEVAIYRSLMRPWKWWETSCLATSQKLASAWLCRACRPAGQFVHPTGVYTEVVCSNPASDYGRFPLTKLTGQTGDLERQTPQRLQINTLRGLYILLQKNARDYDARVPPNCSIFSANWRVLDLVGQFWQKESALCVLSCPFARQHATSFSFYIHLRLLFSKAITRADVIFVASK